MIDSKDWFFDYLKNNIPFCYVRFNDGEMMGIDRAGSIVARGDQFVDKSLSVALEEALKHRQKNYFVGIPCSKCYPKFNTLAKDLIGDYELTTSAVLLTNKNWKYFYDNLPASIVGRNVIWISGKDQDPKKLEEYGLNIKKTLRVENKNSWNYYKPLLNKIPDFIDPGDIVCISLGPTARILCRNLFEKFPETTFVDMGSLLDPVTRDVWFGAHKGWEETGFNLVNRCAECN